MDRSDMMVGGGRSRGRRGARARGGPTGARRGRITFADIQRAVRSLNPDEHSLQLHWLQDQLRGVTSLQMPQGSSSSDDVSDSNEGEEEAEPEEADLAFDEPAAEEVEEGEDEEGEQHLPESTVRDNKPIDPALITTDKPGWLTTAAWGFGWKQPGQIDRPSGKPGKVTFVCDFLQTKNIDRLHFDAALWQVIQGTPVETMDEELKTTLRAAWEDSGVDQTKLEVVISKIDFRVKHEWQYTAEEVKWRSKEDEHRGRDGPLPRWSVKRHWVAFSEAMWESYGREWAETHSPKVPFNEALRKRAERGPSKPRHGVTPSARVRRPRVTHQHQPSTVHTPGGRRITASRAIPVRAATPADNSGQLTSALVPKAASARKTRSTERINLTTVPTTPATAAMTSRIRSSLFGVEVPLTATTGKPTTTTTSPPPRRSSALVTTEAQRSVPSHGQPTAVSAKFFSPERHNEFIWAACKHCEKGERSART